MQNLRTYLSLLFLQLSIDLFSMDPYSIYWNEDDFTSAVKYKDLQAKLQSRIARAVGSNETEIRRVYGRN